MTRCPSSCNSPSVHQIDAGTTISTDLAAQAVNKTKSKAFEDWVPHAYHDFSDVFSKDSFDQLPARKSWDHGIDLIPDAKLFSTKVYPIAPNEQRELDQFLEENLQTCQSLCFPLSDLI